jgi:hypothetical protein
MRVTGGVTTHRAACPEIGGPGVPETCDGVDGVGGGGQGTDLVMSPKAFSGLLISMAVSCCDPTMHGVLRETLQWSGLLQ